MKQKKIEEKIIAGIKQMKLKSKMFALIPIAMPIVYVICMAVFILNIDKKLTYNTISIDYTKGGIDIYRTKGKNFIFRSVEFPNMKFERKYGGFLVANFLVPGYLKKEKPERLSVWLDREFADQFLLNNVSGKNEKIPFFGQQNAEKNWIYYLDIYRYIKDKYILIVIPYTLLFLFASARAFDNYQSFLPLPVIACILWILFIFLI